MASKVKLTISRKVILAFVLVIVLMSVLNGYCMFSSTRYREQYDHILMTISTANGINGVLKQQIDDEITSIVNGKKKFEEGAQYTILKDVNDKISLVYMGASSDEAKNALDSVSRTMQSLNDKINLIGKQINEKKTYEENMQTMAEMNEISALVELNIQDFIRAQLKDSEIVKQKIDEDSKTALGINAIVLCLVILVSIGAVWVITINISRPITKLCTSTSEITKGKLDVERINVHTNDELSILAGSFNEMVESLKEIIGKARSVSTEVSSAADLLLKSAEQNSAASEEIAVSSQKMTEGVHDQGNETQKIKKAIEGMSLSFSNLLQSSDKILQNANQSVDLALEGEKYINGFVSQLENITEVITETSVATGQLNIRTSEMGNILKAIGNISSQTNLLALNASIEAARAGEAGRSFAVVAEEIRKLADESAQAAKKIGDLINVVRTETELISEKMRESAEGISAGNRTAKKTQKYFEEIKESNVTVNRDIQKINAEIDSLQQGFKGTYDSMGNIESIAHANEYEGGNISAAIQEQTANLEEVSASASILSDLAREMEQSIKKFVL